MNPGPRTLGGSLSSAALAVVAAALAGCSTLHVHRLYGGAALLPEQVAVVEVVGADLEVVSIDGSTGPPCRQSSFRTEHYQLLPGSHRLRVRYAVLSATSTFSMRWQLSPTDYDVDLEAGHTYRLAVEKRGDVLDLVVREVAPPRR